MSFHLRSTHVQTHPPHCLSQLPNSCSVGATAIDEEFKWLQLSTSGARNSVTVMCLPLLYSVFITSPNHYEHQHLSHKARSIIIWSPVRLEYLTQLLEWKIKAYSIIFHNCDISVCYHGAFNYLPRDNLAFDDPV